MGKATKPDAVSDNPFAPEIWRRALEIAQTYTILIVQEPEVGYLGRTVEMPFAMSDGRSYEACAANTLEATASGIAVMLEAGQTPPTSLRERKRDQQLNIRITAEERLRLEALAANDGFRSVSDYVRSAALRRAS